MGVPSHIPPTAVEMVRVIYISAHRGDGSKSNPVRLIHLYYATDGRLLACYDPLSGPPDGFFAGGASGDSE
ncbi:hypothetical protein EIL82_14975 [Pandoraea apista]|uniref:Uncharacterized protein n=1 Tax=Pandoraea apista TaxID=93218 RepID=A0ABX9ZKG8_9BURK|nr:hypothetical protein C7830_11495 [Pandoraea apista]RRJ30817.1 hypothetical protein EIB05_13630 [Pandoraea apista]RRJ74556.1 hypothetical protein EIL82_14975 [Pandoraea apista]RSD06409.1 hypothetical protein EJB12_22000 [Pandoraea apista]RSD14561.1 hypothetical protein EIZ52_18175 [Pandoraea apista]